MSYLKNLSLSIFTIAAILVSAGIFAEDKKLEPGFVSMFDGKTLKGWATMPKQASKAWSVKKGVIVGEGDKGRSYLVYEKHDIADFEMKLSYRFPGRGNSGINLRAIPAGAPSRPTMSISATLASASRSSAPGTSTPPAAASMPASAVTAW